MLLRMEPGHCVLQASTARELHPQMEPSLRTGQGQRSVLPSLPFGGAISGKLRTVSIRKIRKTEDVIVFITFIWSCTKFLVPKSFILIKLINSLFSSFLAFL